MTVSPPFATQCPFLFDQELHSCAAKSTADTYIISEYKVNTGRSSAQPPSRGGEGRREGGAKGAADKCVHQNKARKSP